MSRLRNRLLAVLATLAFPAVLAAFIIQHPALIAGAKLFEQVMDVTARLYVDTVPVDSLYTRAAEGVVRELHDPYSQLLTPREAALFSQRVGGEYAGIGTSVAALHGDIIVEHVYPNTPAAEGGLLGGDQILRIDSVDVHGWTEAQVADKLRGTLGTSVRLDVQRQGVSHVVPITLTRSRIHLSAVPYALLLNDHIGYVPLRQFSNAAATELNEAVAAVVRRGATKLILDLRDNPGGFTDQAIGVSNLFLPEGAPILSMRSRDGETRRYTATQEPPYPTLPLVLLVNGNSASSSEIVAGALQDHDRALIVGTTTFGKGVAQTLFPLDGGYVLKLTVQKWFTPNGRSIQKAYPVLPSGSYAATSPETPEGDGAGRGRPVFTSDAGRLVYGGGGITPDLSVAAPPMTPAEQRLGVLLVQHQQLVNAQLYRYAAELRSTLPPDFTVTPHMRAEFLRRLRDGGMVLDDSSVTTAQRLFDYTLGLRVTGELFGDSTAKRKYLSQDVQLQRAVQVLDGASSQQALFVRAAHDHPEPVTSARG